MIPKCIDAALGCLAQQRLELGKQLLDRIEIGRVRRQVQDAGTSGGDGLRNASDFVTGQVVGNDDVARAERGAQELTYPGEAQGTLEISTRKTQGEPVEEYQNSLFNNSGSDDFSRSSMLFT